MKKSMKMHRGFVTISLLILLSSLLLIVLLFDDDSFRLHSTIAIQRQRYIQQHISLQKQFQQQQSDLCKNLDLSLTGNFATASITSPNSDEHQQFIWCQRQVLFKKSPSKNLNEGQFDDFVDKQAFALFQAKAIQNVNYFPTDKGNYLFWFDQANTEWQINGNLNGIVIATGDLHISGKGKITGSVITQGTFSKEDNVTLTYKKTVVTEIVQSYSQWQNVEKTWYDFIP
ncbi:DUF2572 family protein [Lonepinella sp. MS14436]|uniref:DUF2572 family protein n=1 Tax=Lonepinella sp. MS14436 TaxID=3003619 RepID=UPI0036DBE84A